MRLLLPILALAAAATAAVACRDTRPSEARDTPRSAAPPPSAAAAPPRALAQTQRRMAPSIDHPRWVRGGSERDTLFSFPRTLAVSEGHVYVLDADTHRLSALRVADGSLDWQAGGPGDTTVTPVAITAAPAGGVTVADASHARLLTLDARGRPATSTPFAAAAAARSLCTLPGGDVLVAGAEPAGALLRVDSRRPSAPASVVPLPWPDLAGHHRLAIQVAIASSPADQGCAVALALGRGFAIYDGTRYVAHQTYVEHFELPGVTTSVRGDSAAFTRTERLADSRIAARDVALSADRVAVAFDGSSPLRARVVDFYDRRTGAYSHSAPFASRIAAIADDGHDLYVAFMRHGRAAVAVFPYPPSPTRRDSAPAAALTPH